MDLSDLVSNTSELVVPGNATSPGFGYSFMVTVTGEGGASSDVVSVRTFSTTETRRLSVNLLSASSLRATMSRLLRLRAEAWLEDLNGSRELARGVRFQWLYCCSNESSLFVPVPPELQLQKPGSPVAGSLVS